MSIEAMLARSIQAQKERDELIQNQKLQTKKESLRRKADKEYEKYWEKKNSRVIGK